MKPNHHRAFFVVAGRRPHVEILAVFILYADPVGGAQRAVQPFFIQEGAYIAIASGFPQAVPGLHRFGVVKTLGPGVRDPLENAHAVVFVTVNQAFISFYNSSLKIISKLFFHSALTPFLMEDSADSDVRAVFAGLILITGRYIGRRQPASERYILRFEKLSASHGIHHGKKCLCQVYTWSYALAAWFEYL